MRRLTLEGEVKEVGVADDIMGVADGDVMGVADDAIMGVADDDIMGVAGDDIMGMADDDIMGGATVLLQLVGEVGVTCESVTTWSESTWFLTSLLLLVTGMRGGGREDMAF